MKNKKEIFTMIGICLLAGIMVITLFCVLPHFNKQDFKIYLNETEGDELIACCLDINNDVNIENKTICMPEENLEYYEVPCEPIKKDDLTIEWLDGNGLCQDCEGTYDIVYDNYVTCDIKCSKYKFGKYIIEIK